MARYWLWLLWCAGPACAALQPTTTTLTLFSGNPVYGASLNFRATVNASQGNITFTLDGQSQYVYPVDVNGGATLVLSLLPGNHTIGASYNGTDVYQASSAPSYPITVVKATPLVGISGGPAQIGKAVTITATVAVAGYGNVNGGTVTFAPAPGCVAVPVAYGIATCTLTFPSTVLVYMSATFSGDANTTTATATMPLTVSKAVPSVYVTTTPISPIWGTPAGINASVVGATNVSAPTGSVQFLSGGTTIANLPLGADGHASYSGNWDVGSFAVAAVYSGDSNYLASPQVTATLNVGKVSTLLTVSSDPAQIGQPVTLRATVVLAAGTGAITGTVDFALGGRAVTGCTGLAVTSGVATCQTSAAQLGSLTLTGSYSGDAHTMPSTATAAVVVGKAVPGIYLAQSPAAPVYGQSVTINCLLLGATGLPMPTGNIVFSSGGKAQATQPVGTDGRASWTTTLPGGSSTITAAYSGDDNYQSPQPASLALTVGKAPTVMVVSSDPAQIGQPVILHATVSLATGTGAITGSVDFTIGGKAVSGCTGIPLLGGVASCPASFPQLGIITLGGSFSGDANTMAATATAATAVGKAVPGVYLAQSPPAPVFGQPVLLDCMVAGATGLPAPSGSVSFSDSGRFISSQAIGSDGHSSVSTPLTTGTHTVTATYNGDTNYLTASPAPLVVTVSQAATTTSLTVATGGPFTAVVAISAPGMGSPTGTVQFRNGTTVIGTAPLTAKGSIFNAVLATSSATGSITASYLGDANCMASTSSAVSVTAVQSVVTVTSDHNPSSAGQSVTFTTVVSASPQGTAGTPTGSVSLASDGSDLGSAALANGQAVIHATLSAGTHAITARYSGDAMYPASSGTYTQTVSAAVAGLTLGSSAAVAVYGQPVTLTVALQAQTGTVQFTEGGTALGSASITGGTASLAVSLPAGLHTITASWAGDANYAAGTAQLVQTITKATTALSLAISGGSLVATVSIAPPGSGSAGGSVRFLDPATSQLLTNVTLSGLTATTSLPASADSVVAIYSGDLNFFGATSPTLHLLAVTNSASYVSGSVVADEIVTLFGPNLTGSTKATVTDSSGKGFIATLFYVSATQASILIPPGLAPGAATVTIFTPSRPLSALVNVGTVAPGLFTNDGTGQGTPAAQVITLKPDGTPGDPVLATTPIDLHSGAVYLVLYGTGIRHSAALPLCTIAGQSVQVLYAGAQGSMAGLDQVNILVPPTLKSGTVTLNLTVDGNPANAVTLTIR
jgi:uncharacterized protein (TIGR03437 family)